MSDYKLYNGNCLDELKKLPDNSVDSIVTDPPYGLSDHSQQDTIDCLAAWISGKEYKPTKKGFLSKEWDAWVPGPEIWKECLRVLKPGGHILAFAGTRSMDLMCMSVRLAGFQLRDSIGYANDPSQAPILAWAYGSGMPKSMAIDKAIDKSGGGEGMPQNDRVAFAIELKEKRKKMGISKETLSSWFPQYKEVTKNWERTDDGFRVPNENDYNILIEKLGVSSEWRLKVRAEDKRRELNSLLPDRRKDGNKYGLGHSGKKWESTTDEAKKWTGYGTTIKPAWEPIILARKPLDGTVANNVLKWGTGGLNIDGCRVKTEENLNGGAYSKNATPRDQLWGEPAGNSFVRGGAGNFIQPVGRFPANLIHDGSESVVSLFPDSNGAGKSLPNVKITGYGDKNTGSGKSEYYGGERVPFDSGSGTAARFFYCSKASKRDRDEGLDLFDYKPSSKMGSGIRSSVGLKTEGTTSSEDRVNKNNHPTVKPTDLMRYLCRLITPPNGTVLDPFMGSGSTGKAAMLENFNFIGIELDPDYYKIAESRIKHAKENPEYYSEKESKKKKAKSETKKQDSAIDSLFEGEE